jgi:16S rRNA (cytidine1402-2'-O)-methyltransferase
MSERKAGRLSIVATPIGNPADITLRALDSLRLADAVICEELRAGSTLLKAIGVKPKELIDFNEHNETDRLQPLVQRMLQGQSLALISDCGTPVFADPGSLLIRNAAEHGIRIVPIPGPSSLMATLSILDRNIKQFYFAGFPPRDPQGRKSELRRLKEYQRPIVMMDTPYRLSRVLCDVAVIFGDGARITVALDLTLPSEEIFRGRVATALSRFKGTKREFVLVIHAGSETSQA